MTRMKQSCDLVFTNELTICWSEDKKLWLALFFASSATWKPVYVSWKDLCWQFHDLFKRQPPERLTEKKIHIKFKNLSLITNNIGMTINFLTLGMKQAYLCGFIW